MFKNPLKKYQQGGQVSQEQQEMLAAFVEWLPKRVKEFQGMQPEQIVEALNGMTKTPEGQKQVQQLMQQFQQEIQNPQAAMFKEGGKLHDFICKHAKGGHLADCGCVKGEAGMAVPENNGMKYSSRVRPDHSTIETLLEDDGSVYAQRFISPNRQDTVLNLPRGENYYRFTNKNIPNVRPGWKQSYGAVLDKPEYTPGGDATVNMVNEAFERNIPSQEDGGKVEMARGGKRLVDGNYEVTVNAPGDTTRTFYNKYNREVMQTYPDGSVRYTTMSNNGNDDFQVNRWTGKPSLLRRIMFGNKQASPEKVNAWNEEIANQPIDPRNQKQISEVPSSGVLKPGLISGLFKGTQGSEVNDKLVMDNGGVVKGEDGVKAPTVSRREALAAGRNTFGFSRGRARTEYANNKQILRDQGVRGAELLQKAREMMFRMPVISDDVVVEEPEVVLTDVTIPESAPIEVQPIATNTLANLTDEELAKAVMAGKYGNGAARRKALGDRYAAVQSIINKKMAKPTSAPVTIQKAEIPSVSVTQSLMDNGGLQGALERGMAARKERPVVAETPAYNAEVVKRYIDGAGLGIGTDIVFKDGQYIFVKTGKPVEIPTIRKNDGSYVPAVQKNGGVVKGQEKPNWINKNKNK